MTTTLILTIAFFLTVILMLVSLLLFVKAKLSPAGKLKITINGEQTLEVDGGSTLLTTLGNSGVFLPSACGGGGTCVQCKCQVNTGGGSILPTETPHFSRKEIADNWRLGCQVKVKEDMDIQVPEEVFGIKKWECEVVSNYNVASFIKEFVVRLPEGETSTSRQVATSKWTSPRRPWTTRTSTSPPTQITILIPTRSSLSGTSLDCGT